MLGRKTLFIIGAGAGFDITMPMGDDLARNIAEHLNIRFDPRDNRRASGNEVTFGALKLLARDDGPGPDVNPYCEAGRQIAGGLLGWSSSIDGYLNRHQDDLIVQKCGKLAIAQVILESESNCDLYVDLRQSDKLEFRNGGKVRQSWFQALWSILETGIVKSKNLESIFDKLSVITFNYDRTLEHFLHVGLQQAYHLPADDAAAIINEKLDIDHVYGQVGYLPWQGQGHSFPFGRKPESQHLVNLWSRISTFNEEITDRTFLEKLGMKVANAERIVFLGCHFHDQNTKILRSAPGGQHQQISVYATGFKRSTPAITQIKNQIQQMTNPRTPYIEIETNWDCGKLFSEFDTTWAGE